MRQALEQVQLQQQLQTISTQLKQDCSSASVYFTTLIICTITAFIILLAEINFPPNLELNELKLPKFRLLDISAFGSYFIAIIIFFCFYHNCFWLLLW